MQLVQLRMAHASREVAHRDLRRTWIRQIDIVDDHRFTGLDKNSSRCLHNKAHLV